VIYPESEISQGDGFFLAFCLAEWPLFHDRLLSSFSQERVMYILIISLYQYVCDCFSFDTVGWAAGRASGL